MVLESLGSTVIKLTVDRILAAFDYPEAPKVMSQAAMDPFQALRGALSGQDGAKIELLAYEHRRCNAGRGAQHLLPLELHA